MRRSTFVLVLCLGLLSALPASARPHSADTAVPFGSISLSELLRVIQFYNSAGLHCQAGTEDGFAPGPGDTTCAPHDSDYNPQDWTISLSELLRLIQFYNANDQAYHLQTGTEDGFEPGDATN